MFDGQVLKEMVDIESSSAVYRWYVLVMLALTAAFSFMDRQILAILLEDIRAEFTLTDLQLGLLSGVAFAIFYATLSVPIARLADRYSRVDIVSIAVGLWSGMTVLCGAATSFWSLFLARVGVGVGEAGGSAPAHSLVSDYFDKNERSFAMSIYSMGTAAGMLLGLAMGGLVAEHFGWRWAFVAAGAPGIALALIIKLTVREPLRGGMDQGETSSSSERDSFLETFRKLWDNRSYRFVNLGYSVSVFSGSAFTTWLPTLYLRQFDLSQSQVGLIVGVSIAGFATAGLLVGGYLGNQLVRRTARGPALLCIVTLLFQLPFYLSALWSTNWIVTSVFAGAGAFMSSVNSAPALAMIQSSVTPHQRAQAAAYTLLLANLLGLGLGPVLVGAISDMFAPEFGSRSLNIAVGSVMLFLGVSAFFYWLASKALMESEACSA